MQTPYSDSPSFVLRCEPICTIFELMLQAGDGLKVAHSLAESLKLPFDAGSPHVGAIASENESREG